MAQNTSTKAAPVKDETPVETPKAKRVQLTPAERIAKLEAELAATRQKAEEKAGKAATKLRERRSGLVDRKVKLEVEIEAIDKELATLEPTVDATDAGTSDS